MTTSGEEFVIVQGARTTAGPPPAAQPAAPVVPSAPTTRAQLTELRATRDEISSQISNVTARRDELARQLRNALPGADRAGLESRIGTLDARLNELEGTLRTTGQQLAAVRGDAAVFAERGQPQLGPGKLSSGQITGIAVVFIFAVMMPMVIGSFVMRLRRANLRPPSLTPELSARLDRLEQGIDAVAVEVERISEGQRFVSRVLAEPRPEGAPVAARPDALGAGRG